HGSAELLVEIDSGITREQLFVPIHWNDQFASRARIDALVAPLTDPVSGQPEFKYTPASIEPVDSAFWAVAVTRTPWRSDSFPYWHCTPLAQGRGYCYTATAGHNFDWQQWLEHACQAHTGHTQLIKIENPSQEERRFTCWVGEQLQWALFTHTELDQLPSNQWLQSLLMSPAAVSRQTVLQGEQEASVGKIICSCWQVQEARIVQAIDAGANSCDALGEQLKCGTNCGSCIPELNQLIAQRAITMAS
ncbi:MAG: (2Fe-2S)-binding protein, partial [Porticoccaceae bacterium]|nr:(2Fe-2S)-binding protein [Porticoccaceae bacterium]